MSTYAVIEGDLRCIGYHAIPLSAHAYIPMCVTPVEVMTIEDPPVAYLDQMRAKRVADKYRKRAKRRNPNHNWKYTVIGVTVK